MAKDNLSLNNLVDIVLAPQPPLWPPAPGVWLLLASLVCLGGVSIHFWYLRYKNNAYRRAGLVLLSDARTVREIDITLKRVGLAAFERETVAPLYGEEWHRFLDTSCPRCNFSTLESSTDGNDVAAYKHCAANWIRYHRRQQEC